VTRGNSQISISNKAGCGVMVRCLSPYVARYLNGHLVERTVLRGVLYPLIGILGLSSLVFSEASGFPELAAGR
jgi:hypothetical protein